MDVDIMVDCLKCGSQVWEVDDRSKNSIRFVCGECEHTTTVGLDSNIQAYDCHICLSKTWSIIDREDEHYIFNCDECGLTAEFWLNNQD